MYIALLMALWLLQSNASIKGEVRLDNKRPLDRPAEVELFHMGQRVADLFAAPDGGFSIEGIETGPYLLSIHSPGYADATVAVTVLGNSGGGDITVNLRSRTHLTDSESAVVSVHNYRPVPKSVAKALSVSDQYILQKRYDDAEKLLKDIIRKSPNEGDPYFGLARVYFEQSRLADVLASGTMAHPRNHRNADVHLLLAKTYAKLGDAVNAASELKMFVEETPAGSARSEAIHILRLLTEGQ